MPTVIYKGAPVILDECDMRLLEMFSWSWTASGYLLTKVPSTTGRKSVCLHRMIVDPEDGMWVDHINGDKSDCRRLNLRACTPSQNSLNRNPWSELPGVSFNKHRNKWQVVVRNVGKIEWHGYYPTKEEAEAKAKEILPTISRRISRLY